VRQPEYQIVHKDKVVGKQQLDIFVASEVVVEIKVVPQLTPLHQAQLFSYLKTVGKQVGLLFNFGETQPVFKRIYFSASSPVAASSPAYQAEPDLLFPELSYQVLGGVFEVYRALGPGYIHRIYANASAHEMRLRGLAAKPLHEMSVLYRAESIGVVKFGHLQIEDKIMLFPTALRETEQIEPDNLRQWMQSQHIPLGILANFHATPAVDLRFIRAD
jgi:GxxExxY protein